MKQFTDCSGECCVCFNSDGNCLAGHGDDYFSLASKTQLINRLNNSRFSNHRQFMIDTLKNSYGYEYAERKQA